MTETELPALARYLRDVREANKMSLRAVETATDKTVTNGYLSQIENGQVKRPAPNVLHALAGVYGVDYRHLLELAGHHLPQSGPSDESADLAGLPLRAMAELTDSEKQDLLEYVAFLKQRRRRTTHA